MHLASSSLSSTVSGGPSCTALPHGSQISFTRPGRRSLCLTSLPHYSPYLSQLSFPHVLSPIILFPDSVHSSLLP
jgi:hypothetical protein